MLAGLLLAAGVLEVVRGILSAYSEPLGRRPEDVALFKGLGIFPDPGGK
jgi:hypothetical protein